MELGVNFVRGRREGLAFNPDAIRALRPPLVRLVVTDPQHVTKWAEAARTAQLRILWCLPVEEIGYPAARQAVRSLRHLAWDVSAGLEIGDRPGESRGAPGPGEFLGRAIVLGQSADGVLGPVLLGAGFDGGPASSAYFSGLLKAARHVAGGAHEAFAGGITCHSRPGRPLSRLLMRGVAHQVGGSIGRHLAFTRVGWSTGEPLGAWTSLRETFRSARRHGLTTQREHTRLTAEMRDRWTVEAFERATELSATHFVLAARTDRQDGINAWGAYDPIAGRVDPTWQTLLWRTARRSERLEA